jgi:hypothetical protein
MLQVAIALGAVYLIWGSSYLAIRFAIETIPPFLMAAVRYLTAGAMLYAWSRLRGAPRPQLIHWRSAAILGRIYRDEIRHVAAGTSWFGFACESRGHEPVAHWQKLIRAHFKGMLKPPFNDSARGQAGLSREYYSGLAAPAQV